VIAGPCSIHQQAAAFCHGGAFFALAIASRPGDPGMPSAYIFALSSGDQVLPRPLRIAWSEVVLELWWPRPWTTKVATSSD
jgi:hypothetical protein